MQNQEPPSRMVQRESVSILEPLQSTHYMNQGLQHHFHPLDNA